MDIELARTIHDNVREHFKEGTKSGNKAYASPDDDELGHSLDKRISRVATGAKPIALTEDMTKEEQHTRRNHNVALAITQVASLRLACEKAHMTAIEYGQHIVTKKIRYGNCTEMACVAAYLTSKRTTQHNSKMTPAWYISIVATGGPGDHVFCMVGRGSEWEKVQEPPKSAEAAIVIDPWANVCTTAAQYGTAFATKMNLWLGKGKRISTGGNNWEAPGEQYMNAFNGSDLVISNAWEAEISTLFA